MKTFKERLREEIEKGKELDEAEAIIYLVWYNEWRIGAVDEMPEPSKLTEAINIIVKEYKKRNL
jgi:hypothetical protein